jgi:TniQ protein
MELEPIYPYDSAWLRTFPHRVAPQPGEWFPGLLLRCDEVNHWGSGTTQTHLLRSISSYPLRGKPSWIVVPMSVLELLAQLLAIPLSILVATTYKDELARLYNTTSPHVTYLNRSFPFHLCPDCIAEKRLLRRIFALPHITCCPFHHLRLVKTCQCGTMLQMFHRHTLPFACHKCSLDWTNVSHISADPERIALEQHFLSLYEFFFTKGTPIILAKALQLIRESAKRKKTPWVRCPDGGTKYVECYDAKRVSLGALVELLVSLDFTFHDIMVYEGMLPWWSVKS